jgi:HNH endonuclease
MITAEKVRELLNYDPSSGVFTWRVRPGNNKIRHCGRFVKIFFHRRRRDGSNGYSKHFAHRVAWLWMTGEWPVAEIEHKDGNRSNNRWGNLREKVSSLRRPAMVATTDTPEDLSQPSLVLGGFLTNGRRESYG